MSAPPAAPGTWSSSEQRQPRRKERVDLLEEVCCEERPFCRVDTLQRLEETLLRFGRPAEPHRPESGRERGVHPAVDADVASDMDTTMEDIHRLAKHIGDRAALRCVPVADECADRRCVFEEDHEESPERLRCSVLQQPPAQRVRLVSGVAAQYGDDGEAEHVGAGCVVDEDELDVAVFGEEDGVDKASANIVCRDVDLRRPETRHSNGVPERPRLASVLSRLVPRNTF